MDKCVKLYRWIDEWMDGYLMNTNGQMDGGRLISSYVLRMRQINGWVNGYERFERRSDGQIHGQMNGDKLMEVNRQIGIVGWMDRWIDFAGCNGVQLEKLNKSG